MSKKMWTKTKVKRLTEIYSEMRDMKLPLVRDFKEGDFNKYIMVGFLPGAPINKLIGKVVQCRMESGDWGSNEIFMRQFDSNLQCHTNQWFYFVPEQYFDELDKIFKSAYVDEPNIEYTIKGEKAETGFIIVSKVKDGETTPMREVRKDFFYALSNLGV